MSLRRSRTSLEKPRGWGDLGVRSAVGIALALAGGLAVWEGGLLFWALVSLAAVLMMGEWARLVGASEGQRRLAMFAVSVPLAVTAPLAAGPYYFALGLFAAVAIFVLLSTRRLALAQGVFYVAAPAMALLWLRVRPDDGLAWCVAALGTVVAADVCAYFAGRLIGGPKLWPAVSPNKTWAGLAGAAVGATGFLWLVVARTSLPTELVFGGPLLAVIAQMGDLFESHLKRQAGVKDSGALLPGHGGVLDRLDGLVAVAPALAILALVIG